MKKVNFADCYDEMMSYVEYDEWVKLLNFKIRKETKGINVLEIGSGTGEISNRLNELGYKVKGIDISSEMVEISKFKYKNIEFSNENMLNLKDIREYDAVISVFDTINYLHSLDELNMAFINIYNSIKNNGVFIFDVLNRKMINSMFFDDIFADDRENMSIIWKHSYNENLKLDEIETIFYVKEKDDLFRRISDKYMKMIFTNNQILEMAKSVGFYFVSKEINVEIAGPRVIYVFKRVD